MDDRASDARHAHARGEEADDSSLKPVRTGATHFSFFPGTWWCQNRQVNVSIVWSYGPGPIVRLTVGGRMAGSVARTARWGCPIRASCAKMDKQRAEQPVQCSPEAYLPYQNNDGKHERQQQAGNERNGHKRLLGHLVE
jgi:hypothetical protein